MKLNSLKVAGFRGFNRERLIDFSEKLTVISAPNSHGKTSITEALEFLIYGETSKVAHAESKEEYRDSYRNRHYPKEQPAFIEATFDDLNEPIVLRVEIDATGASTRFVNGLNVNEWPFSQKLVGVAPPFVLQHALKNLLLAVPSERFQGFAKLLGLNEVDRIQQAIVNLCTKPEGSLPESAKQVLVDMQRLEDRLGSFPEIQAITKDFKRGLSALPAAYKRIHERATKLLGKSFQNEQELLSAILAARDEAASKVYAGTVGLQPNTPERQAQVSSARETIATRVDASLLEAYGKCATHDAIERIRKEATLLEIGVELIIDAPDKCPVCGQTLTDEIRTHISDRHAAIKHELDSDIGKEDPQTRVARDFSALRSDVVRHRQLLETRCRDLLAAVSVGNQKKLQSLFGVDNAASWQIVEAAGVAISASLDNVQNAETDLQNKILNCEAAIKSRSVEMKQAEVLADSVHSYLSTTDSFIKTINELESTLTGPARLLRQAIDAAAGTAQLSILIEVLEKKATITKVLKIRDVLESVKSLKKHVEQTVGELMESAFGTDLTGSVMNWYSKIRTLGDPDVHFSGFAMERTKGGDFKSRRVKVAAKSYGVELASAVSSLSESKLNALGLCMSIATALRASGLWGFLILDDPIQSWDEEHEVQFIEVLRSLVEQEKKQIILLSHREQWVNQVTLGCRTINGHRYRITGYTKDGPQIMIVEWAAVDQRLGEALSIANDPNASPIRLQQAEEEIRIAACQLATEIAKRKLKRDRSPHNLNSKDVRSILSEAGCSAPLLDRVAATFGTTDDAHHAPKKYQVHAERIRQYHSTLSELKNWIQTQ